MENLISIREQGKQSGRRWLFFTVELSEQSWWSHSQGSRLKGMGVGEGKGWEGRGLSPLSQNTYK